MYAVGISLTVIRDKLRSETSDPNGSQVQVDVLHNVASAGVDRRSDVQIEALRSATRY
jgi:hypothetical protein